MTEWEVTAMVIRFKESIRVRVWGRELSNFRKGEIHAVPTAVAGVLLAQGCAEPVSDERYAGASQGELVRARGGLLVPAARFRGLSAADRGRRWPVPASRDALAHTRAGDRSMLASERASASPVGGLSDLLRRLHCLTFPASSQTLLRVSRGALGRGHRHQVRVRSLVRLDDFLGLRDRAGVTSAIDRIGFDQCLLRCAVSSPDCRR